MLAMSSVALAIPVTYKGIIDYDDIGSTTALKAESSTGTTEKQLNQTSQQTAFVLNHLGNEGETVNFYFGTTNIRAKTQPKPGTIVDMGNIIIPFGKPIIHSKNPSNDSLSMTERETTMFSIIANDSKGAALDYFWYKNGALVSMSNTYSLAGNNTNKGSNAGTYNIKARVYNKLTYSDYSSWTLIVKRVKDSDGDSIADKDDNCIYVANTDQADANADDIGDACASDLDGDGVNDTDDTLIGDISQITTNVGNMEFRIGNDTNTSRQIADKQIINFTNGADTILEFNFNFSKDNLTMSNISIQIQSGNDSNGGIIISGIDLTKQGETKTAYVDRLAAENYVCVKDVEVASITELPSSACTGTSENPVPCSTAGSSAYGYTCTIIGNKFRVDGLIHSGVSESAYTPPAPAGDTGVGGGGGGAGGGGGGGCAPGYKLESGKCIKIEVKPIEKTPVKEVPKAEEVIPAPEEVPAAPPVVTPPSAAPKRLGAITGAVIGEAGNAIKGLFATKGRNIFLDVVAIVLALAAVSVIFIANYGGLPLADQFTRASNLHRRADEAYKKGKHAKAEKLHKKAQMLREKGERGWR